VNLPVRHTYTYKVPPELMPRVRVGCMVKVPVVKQMAEGVIVDFQPDTTVPKKKIKPIREVLTPDYSIPPDLMALGKWISEYYLSGPGETFATISFFGLRGEKPIVQRRLALADPEKTDYYLRRAPDAPTTNGDGGVLFPGLTSRQREVAVSFLDHRNDPVTRTELMRREGCSGSVIGALIQAGVLEERESEIERQDAYSWRSGASGIHDLLPEQKAAFESVCEAMAAPRFEALLLHGITGSGKTEIYLQAIARALGAGREAIVLVPEISLTPQAVDRFRSRFGDQVGVYHSQLSPGQKYDLWRRIESGRVRILIGARSAVFAPFPHLGLIVVDEEHEHSYKQGDPAPRYHARDVAIWRARHWGIPVVLGSATPCLESIRNARSGKYRLLELTRRVGKAQLPEIRLIDMGAHVRESREAGLISEPLRVAVENRLAKGEKTILFLNRRGFANFLLCMSCKKPIRCDHCDVVMTWHKTYGKLMCHMCGDTKPKPEACPECGAPDPAPLGAGTQRIEEEVAVLFPDARIMRVDLDSASGKNGFLRLWDQIESGQYDILLGTQMIAKGLHLESVTLVGVISADHSLFMPDFRSAERTFAQLTQVAGRAGRMHLGGEVILQTFIPHHYAIQRAVNHDSEGFYRMELHMREILRFPPHFRLLLIRLTGEDAGKVAERARRLGRLLKDKAAIGNAYRSLSIYGPVSSPISRIKDRFRWQVVIRGESPSLMRRLLGEGMEEYERDKGRSGVSLVLDMDPIDLL